MAREKEIEYGEVGAETQYVPLSEEALKELAIGVVNDKVFGSWMLPEYELNLLGMIFMPLSLMDDISRKQMRRDGIVHLFQWKSEAGPRGINGYPIFMSFRTLNEDDTKRLSKKIKQVQEALDAL
jgi:hypothetical protein